jgi:acyl-CoA thioesterase
MSEYKVGDVCDLVIPPKFIQQQRWISINKELPERETYVFIYLPYTADMLIAKLMSAAEIDFWDCGENKLPMTAASHWHALPALPVKGIDF